MRVGLIAVLALSTGCVSQSVHDALKADHAKTLSELDQARSALAQEEAKARALEEKLAQLEQQLGATQKDKSSLESNVEQMKSNVEQMKEALAELRKRKAEADARITEFKALVGKFKTLIDAGKLKVRIREGRMVVALATDVLFPSGSSTLNKEGKAAIAEVAGLLASIPDRKFQIEGHTDNVPVRGNQYFANWGLAANRALTVLSTMIEAGMPPERISAASFGESAPAKPNDTPENRAANRRIEIVVVPDLTTLPGFDELQRVSNE
ncbi:MAG TPA: flagellar motor protein MotB [Myxococcaceae bacterium]|nr:flagellar motor protein MotB [Myxococcaceae bacterium]